MKLSILSFIALFLCLTLTKAQLNTFDLSKYKTADYTRRMLTFSGNISGDYREDKNESGINVYSKSFLSNLKLNYSFNKNTRKAQQETHFDFILKPGNYGYSSHSQSTSSFYNYSNFLNNSNNGGLYFNSANRYYFKSNKFVEINPTTYLEANFNKEESKNINNGSSTDINETKRSLSSNLGVPVSIGIGRLENVEDARLAIFILDDLKKNKQLTKAVSDEDILSFATKITQLRNKRHFDSRKRRIYEIQALDSFLRNNGYSGSQDAVYFSALIDNWSYASNPWRLSGNRFSIGISPNVGYSIQNILSDEKNNSFEKGLGISLGGNLEKPLSLKWQRSIEFRTGYRISDQHGTSEYNSSPKTKTHSTIDEVILSGSFGYGFYPDSRSYHKISLRPQIQKVWGKYHSTNAESTDLYYTISFSFNGYFYISERLYVNYNLSAGYNESNIDYTSGTIKKNNFATSFNLSCSYSIF